MAWNWTEFFTINRLNTTEYGSWKTFSISYKCINTAQYLKTKQNLTLGWNFKIMKKWRKCYDEMMMKRLKNVD